MNAKQVLNKIVEFLSASEVELTYAKLADGTIVESPTFDVGEPVEVVSEDGTKTPAPDGEHELMLKDESGNENLIKVITKDGKIVERENVELADEKTQVIPQASGDVPESEVAKDETNQVKSGTQKMATEEVSKDMPETDGEPLGPVEDEGDDEIEINLGDLKKKMEEMAYRIEEMEKKMQKMEMPVEPPVDEKVAEEVAMEEEELPKLDGAPVEEGVKFSQEKIYAGKKVVNSQSTFLSKLYK